MSFWRDLLGGGSMLGDSRFAGATDIGCKRRMNQDGWAIGSAGEKFEVRSLKSGPLLCPGWVAVADGMGGAKGGDVASRRALEIVAEGLREGQSDREAALAAMELMLRDAHGQLDAEARADPALKGMGCTFSGLWWPTADPRRVVLGQVGDSRIYRWRGRQLTQLTRDQTLVQRLLDDGTMTAEGARRARFSSVLEFALGAGGGAIEPEVRWLDLAAGDVLLLCSDGLHGVVSDTELARLLPGSPQRDLIRDCQGLIDAARDAGGPDNITAVLVQVGRSKE